MSQASASKARRSLTEQFELLYPANGSAPRAPVHHQSNSPQRQLGRYSGGGASTISSNADGINSVAFLHETIRNHATELELERRTREAAVRDLSARTSVEIGELREMIKQLRQENATLKDSMWALERRKVPMIMGSGEGATHLTAEHYYGGAAALAHVQMPLIPRVTDLETAVEQLRQKITKLQGVEKAREESLQKALVDLQVQQRGALDHAKDFTRSECDRREASRIDPLEQQVRDLASSHHEAQRAAIRALSESNAQLALFGDRIRVTEAAVADGQHDRQSQQHLEEWKRTIRASTEVEVEKVHTIVADLKADLAKAIRKQEAADIEVQDAMQTYIGQKVDVVRAEMLPREEMAKLYSTVSSAQKDVDRATSVAQAAKVAAEETKRELIKRVSALEAEEASVAARLGQIGTDVATSAQAAKAASTAVDELRSSVKSNQTTIADQHERLSSAVTKQFEQAGMIDSVSLEVTRLKASQASLANTEATERQQLRERLYVAEDEVKALKGKLANLEDTQVAAKKESDRAIGELRATAAAEERASVALAQQRLTLGLAAVEVRLTGVGEKVDAQESATQKLKEELLAAVRSRIEDAKESMNAKVEGVEEGSKSRDKDIRESIGRVEEKSAATVAKLKGIEGSLDTFTTLDQLEKALAEAKDAQSKASARQQQEVAKDMGAIREDIVQLKASNDKAVTDLGAEIKAKSHDTAHKAAVEDLKAQVQEALTAVEQCEATVASTIQKSIKDRVKPLQDAQAAQKEEFEEFQSLVSELAHRLKEVVVSVDKHSIALSDQDKAIEAVEKSSGSIFNELMMAVSVACSHDQQFGSSHGDVNGTSASSALTPAPTANIKSLGDVVQYVLNYVADSQQEQQEQQEQLQGQLQNFEQLREPSMRPDVLTEEDLHAALQTVSGPLMELTKIVDRHEVGFSTISELVQAIRFNNKGILTVAGTVGIDKEGLRLRTFDDADLMDAVSEAVADTKDRDLEIADRERNWM